MSSETNKNSPSWPTMNGMQTTGLSKREEAALRILAGGKNVITPKAAVKLADELFNKLEKTETQNAKPNRAKKTINR